MSIETPAPLPKGIVNLMNHSLTWLQHIAVMIFLNARYCIISHLVILELTMPFVELTLVGGRVAAIRDFRYVPYIAREAVIEFVRPA
jgi:hypothetical protein